MASARSSQRSLAALGCGLGLLLAAAAAAQSSAERAPDQAARPAEQEAVAPGTPPAGEPPAPPGAEKLAELRSEVSALIDDLVQARARAALLGKSLFKTQVRVSVQNLAGPDPVLAKIILKLDGAPIYRGDAAALGGDDARKVFESFLAPGAHVLSAEIEQRSRDDAAYGYTLHESYRFQALREKRSELTLILDDDSDLASEFPDDAAGEYDVRIKLRVRTRDLKDD
jgi:hypothetical protein